MRLAFLGTPAFAVPILEALVDAGHHIVKVYAQPARPTGRGHKVQPSAVERRASELGLDIATPLSLKDPVAEDGFASLDLDLAVVAAYGQILTARVLGAPRRGCINVHASLLPRWRGAAPIQRAILAGDTETGISIMRMEQGLDTGPVLLAERVRIDASDTATTLQARLAELGRRLIVDAIRGLSEDALVPVAQPSEGVTYAAKLTRAEGQLDWRQDAAFNARKVRALTPAPGVWFAYDDERIKVIEASAEPGTAQPGAVVDARLGIACAEGIFRPILLQRPGRSPVPVDAFLNGLPIAPGTVLACPATS